MKHSCFSGCVGRPYDKSAQEVGSFWAGFKEIALFLRIYETRELFIKI
jgi:hypothetical protein